MTLWWITLGVGLVVALVVVVLLEALRRTVENVRVGVEAVLLRGGQLAQNTWTVQLLATTRSHAAELVEELERRES